MGSFLSAHLLGPLLVRHGHFLFKIGSLTLCCMQWTSTQGAVTFSFLQVIATRPAQGTKRMTHLLALLRAILEKPSRLHMETVRLSAASSIMTLLGLLVWLYVELGFLFYPLQSAYTSQHRR